MIIQGKNYRTVWMEGNAIYTIDQRLLPHKFTIAKLKTVEDVSAAIKNMVVRGAPAIGGMAAFGMALSALSFKGNDIKNLHKTLEVDGGKIKSTRPTARDLFYAVDAMVSKIKSQAIVKIAKKTAIQAANDYANNSLEACRMIGEFGNKLIKQNYGILTHCNAGSLATIDYGTALAPIRIAHYSKKHIHVFVDETRPRNQGNLTAWELVQEKIPHAVIADNAAGYYMKKGEINMVITGADRIAANGDVANKIGTYEKAVLARENNIPFYVAAPTTTFDLSTENGDRIPIEERSEDEMAYVFGYDDDGNAARVRIMPKGSHAKNPAFDVTQAKYIAGIITEKGIIKANREEIKNLIK
ncbi:MAG: S-methyl-5-thioribose-1-phosphate isomerase [Nanoarchaeota archaeon]